MANIFERSGVRFEYPSAWTAEASDADDGWTVVVQSPGTAFVLVSLRADAADPAELAALTLAALREDYQEIEAEEVVEAVAGLPAVGHDIDFLTLDTPVSCWSRCLDTAGGVLLVLCQTSEFDRDRHAPAFAAIRASIVVEE